MLRLDQTRSRKQTSSRPAAQTPASAIQKAEQDYHACLADFGHNSGEAHAARQVWHSLRQRAQTGAA